MKRWIASTLLILLLLVPSTVNATSATLPVLSGPVTEINAYAVGVPQGLQGFAGYTFPNQTSVMPQEMTAIVHSPGNSSVTIYLNSKPVVVNEPFNWTLRYFFSAAPGVQSLNFTVSSQQLQMTRQMTYVVNVMTVAQFITYLNQHSQQGYFVTTGVLWDIVGIAVAVTLFAALLSIPVADGLHKRRQRKKGLEEEI